MVLISKLSVALRAFEFVVDEKFVIFLIDLLVISLVRSSCEHRLKFDFGLSIVTLQCLFLYPDLFLVKSIDASQDTEFSEETIDGTIYTSLGRSDRWTARIVTFTACISHNVCYWKPEANPAWEIKFLHTLSLNNVAALRLTYYRRRPMCGSLSLPIMANVNVLLIRNVTRARACVRAVSASVQVCSILYLSLIVYKYISCIPDHYIGIF
jgi:hypothetical protein